jgi:hypothetical protein
MSISKLAEDVLREVKADMLLKKVAKEEVHASSAFETSLGRRLKKLAELLKSERADITVTVKDLEKFIYQ